MEWLKYLLEVSACTTLFFGFYFLVLRRLTFFRFNRFYLLGTLLMSFIIPALQFSLQRELAVKQAEVLPYHPELKFNNATSLQRSQPLKVEYNEINAPINWFGWLPYVYGAIGLLILFSHLLKLFMLLKYTTNYVKNEAGLKLVSKKTGFTNCSFFNYVFIDHDSLSETELDVLIMHEQVHARQFHAVDKLLLVMVKSLLWFNPIVYFYDWALEQVNEYEADETTSANVGNHAYANLLLKLAITKNEMPLVLNFVKSPIKDRIKMLFNSKSKRMKKLVYLLVLPVVFGLVWLLSVEVVYAEKVVPEYKLKSGDVKVIDSGQARSNTILNQKQKIKKILRSDSAKRSSRSVIPKIKSFKKITGDTKTKISLMHDAEIEIKSDVLRAESVELNRRTNILTARNASLTNDLGDKTIAKLFVFDLNKGNYKVFSGKQDFKEIEIRKIQSKPSTEDSKVYYKGDSVKFSKNRNVITLFGNAKLSYGDIDLLADEIIYDNTTKKGTAKNVKIKTLKKGISMDGTDAKFDLTSKGKFELWQSDN